MSKNTNLSFLTDYITADITNGRIGINNASPTVAFDVVGATKITGVLTLTSTISNGTYAYTLPSATGTLALTSALSGYLPLTGGTLTGALGGTSATFSSSVTSDDLILTAGTLFSAGNTGFSNRLSDTTLYLQMPATGFNITDNALNTRFILSSAGAATFSSSVTAGSSGQVFLTGNAGTASIGMRFTNTGGNSFIGLSNSGGTGYLSGTAYAFNIQTEGAQDLQFGTNNANRMVITSAGNIGINNSDPQKLLHITNTSSATTTDTLMLQNGGNTSNSATGVRLIFKIGGFAANQINTYATIDAVNNGESSVDLLFKTPSYGILFPPNERMRITGAGLVGIGTSAPAYPLQVVGTAVASNFFSAIGTQLIQLNTWTTFYTLAADQGMYTVSIGLGENVFETWYAYGTIFTAISRAIFLSSSNGTLVSMRVSGMDVQVLLGSGAGFARTLNYKVLRS